MYMKLSIFVYLKNLVLLFLSILSNPTLLTYKSLFYKENVHRWLKSLESEFPVCGLNSIPENLGCCATVVEGQI